MNPVAEEVQQPKTSHLLGGKPPWTSACVTDREAAESSSPGLVQVMCVCEALVCVQVNPGRQPGDCVLTQILEQQKELQKTLNLHLGCRAASCKFMLLTARINKGFFIFYVTAVSAFLLLIFVEWSS